MIYFIEKTIGSDFLISETVIVSDVHQYSSPKNPIVFLLEESSEEPSSDLTKLADLQGIASSKVKYLALSSENTDLALTLLETAFIRGQWLIFQNVDLVPNFLPKLEKTIQEKDDDDIHEDFRVWMTWCKNILPPFSLLQKAVILYCEPSRDIRFHERNFFYNVSRQGLQSQNYHQCLLFLTLCYLLKIFVSRQKYSALCWNGAPDFPNYLMQVVSNFIDKYFDTNAGTEDKIQYHQLILWTQVKRPRFILRHRI
jgi:Dynein heavy chain region D6 P-loop domain